MYRLINCKETLALKAIGRALFKCIISKIRSTKFKVKLYVKKVNRNNCSIIRMNIKILVIN